MSVGYIIKHESVETWVKIDVRQAVWRLATRGMVVGILWLRDLMGDRSIPLGVIRGNWIKKLLLKKKRSIYEL